MSDSAQAKTSVQKLYALAQQMKKVREAEEKALVQLRAIEASRDAMLESYSNLTQEALIVISGCDVMKKEITEITRSVIQELNG